MSPKTEKQVINIRNERESQILSSALKLFANSGYVTTSMHSVAKDARVSKGNLYNYFESKEDLLNKVLHKGVSEFVSFYGEAPKLLVDEEDFKRIIHNNFELIKSNIDYWKLYYNLVAQPGVQHIFTEVFTPVMSEFVGLFNKYYQNKGVENTEIKATLLGSSFDGIMLGYIMLGEDYPIELVIDELIKNFK